MDNCSRPKGENIVVVSLAIRMQEVSQDKEGVLLYQIVFFIPFSKALFVVAVPPTQLISSVTL